MKKGMVYLVGAGSGDPALLTQKGQQGLQLADLVVYDALASVSILNHVRWKASRKPQSSTGRNQSIIGGCSQTRQAGGSLKGR